MRTVLADDHLMVREGLKRVLSKLEGIEIVAECVDGAEAVEKARETACELLIVDIGMPRMSGLEALRAVKAWDPAPRVVMLSMFSDPGNVGRAVADGADGYLLKDDDESTVLSVVRNVMAGVANFSPRIQSILASRLSGADRSPEDLLTPREMELFRCIVRGYQNKRIASELGIAPRTVDFHKRNLRDALGVESVADLVRLAQRYGIA